MIRYGKADLEIMLQWLAKDCDEFSLARVGANQWKVYVYSQEFGEYEDTGTLAQVVIGAFKPFSPEFEEWAERTKRAFIGLTKTLINIAEEKGKDAN